MGLGAKALGLASEADRIAHRIAARQWPVRGLLTIRVWLRVRLRVRLRVWLRVRSRLRLRVQFRVRPSVRPRVSCALTESEARRPKETARTW